MVRKITYISLIVYALLVSYSVFSRFLGIAYLPAITPLVSLTGFTFAVLHAGSTLGWKRGILLFVLTFIISLFFECLGVATGLVYGPYHYTEKLGIKFLNLVPLLIPITWFMMSYPSYIIAVRLVNLKTKLWIWHIGVAIIGAFVMTTWDIAMDPMMVAGGHWVWDVHGSFFGIPAQNYWGWLLTVFTVYFLFNRISLLHPGDVMQEFTRENSYGKLAFYSYIVTTASTIITDFQANLAGPALAGLFAVIPWIFLSFDKENNTPG